MVILSNLVEGFNEELECDAILSDISTWALNLSDCRLYLPPNEF